MVKRIKQRSMWLTSTLLVLIVLQSLGILNYLYACSKQPEWLVNSFVLGTVILAILQLIGLILIFRWKKFGTYLYISVCLVSIVTGYITSSKFILGGIMNMVVYLIILGIVYYLILPIWDNME